MKYLILKTIVLLVALMFIGTAFFVAETHDYNSATSGNRSNIGITMFSQKSGPNNSGYVKYTLDLTNNTLINGNFVNTHNGLFPSGAAFDSSNGYVYVTDFLSNSVSVINGSSNRVISTIDVGSPDAATYDSSNGYVYVSNCFSSSVSVINGSTNNVISTIDVGQHPSGAAFDSSNGYVYVANAYSNNVSVINGSTNNVISTISVGSGPSGVAFDPTNGYIYVTNYESDNVSVINGSSNNVISTIDVGSYPQRVAFDSANAYVYVTNSLSNNVSVINGTSNKLISTVDVGSYPHGVAFDPTNGYIYVTNDGSGNVSVINGSTNNMISTISVGSSPYGAVFDSSNGYVYVTNTGSGNVSVINGSSNRVISTIDVGSGPLGAAFDPTNGYIYVTNYESDNVSVINGSSNRVISTIDVGSGPLGAAFDSANGHVYVTDFLSNNVSVINSSSNMLIATISVGSGPIISIFDVGIFPSGTAFDPTNGYIYVTNVASGTVSIISTSALNMNYYTLIFTESGLPSGTSWSVTLNGTTESGPVSGTTGTIEFTEPNGTYPYTVGTVSGYTSSPSSGTVDVNGSNKQISIQFHIYHINSPRPIWAFDGAYFNYSRMAPTSHGIFPITYFELIDNVNHTTGMLNITQVTSGQGIKGNRSYNNYTDSWNNFFPVGFNSSVLSELNNGTIPVIPDAFTSTANVHVTTGVYVSTPMGTFRTDELTFLTADSNNGSRVNLSLYIDSYSGILLKYAIPYNSTENVTFLLQSTNAPLTGMSSILKLNITPSNSMVSVNDIPVALSSGHASLTLSPGTYYVSVTASGYNPGFFEVNMTANNVIYLNKTLTPSSNTTYSLSGFVNPSNSSVVIGQYVVSTDTAGYYSITLPSGNYTISVTDSGYYPVTENLTLLRNMMDQNFTLARLPASTSSRSVSSVTATGYNVTISNLLPGNGNISVQYSATTNGTLMVVIPYSDIQNATVNDVMNSRLYINGTPYTNFTVAISSQNGAYNVILTVKNLTGDPTLVWLYSPTATLHTTSSTPSSLPPYVLDLGMIAVVAVVISIAALAVRKKKNK